MKNECEREVIPYIDEEWEILDGRWHHKEKKKFLRRIMVELNG